MRRIRVGLAQINPTVGAIEANARLVLDWMERARAAGCDLVAFPELAPTGPTTLQALAGAELVVTINASPYHAGKAQFREKMLATRAADDLVCLAFVNTVGGQDELVFDGQSFIFNEKGERIARGRAFEEDLVVADLDLDEIFRARLHDSRRPKEKLRSG